MSSRSGEGRPLTRAERVRLVGNVLNLSTPLGLAVAGVGRARLRRGPRGLVLAEHYRLPFPVAGAFTVGNVVTTSRTFEELTRGVPDLLAHEDRHAWQYLWCLGLPFLPAYALGMAWSVLRTGDRAAANLFERHAGLVAGGYLPRPNRPLAETLALLTSGRIGRGPHQP